MDSLEIQGKTYISSKRASELTGYAKDYVGQLARSGKLPGVRVGRAWYVDADTLAQLAKLTVQTRETTDVTTTETSKNPLITLATLKSLSHQDYNPFNVWSNVVYSSDDDPLIPPLASATTYHGDTAQPVAVTVKSKIIHISSRVSKLSGVDGVRVTSPTILRRIQTAPATHVHKNHKSVIMMLLTATGVMTLVVVFSFTGHWIVAPNGSVQVAQTVFGEVPGIDLQAYLSELFHMGIELMRSFFTLILGSVSAFLLSGFEFFIRLFHLG